MERVSSSSVHLTELKNYLESSNNDANLVDDWITLRLLKAKLLTFSLIYTIKSLFSRIKEHLRVICLSTLNPFCHLLYDLYKVQWYPLNNKLADAFDSAVRFCKMPNDWNQKPSPEESLFRAMPNLISLCYELLYPFYSRIKEIQELHQALLERTSLNELMKNVRNVSPALLSQYRLLYEHTTSEDIRCLDSIK